MDTQAIPPSWRAALATTLESAWFASLCEFVDAARAAGLVFPPEAQTFAALEATPLEAVRVVILGQDPYPNAGQGHGLCFSVQAGVRPPPSLQNIAKELSIDLGIPGPRRNGNLAPWAERGALLLNTVLTVAEGQPRSHAGRGWEQFTDAVLQVVNARAHHVVFLLWGKDAAAKATALDGHRHTLLVAAHPSPLAARRGFFGSRPFSRANAALRAHGQPVIDWTIPD